MPSADPTVVHTLAVTVEDAVTAHEANQRGDASTVLRLTPPFSGRMRARIHRGGVVDADPAPVHVPPAALLDDDVPGFPAPDDTEDAIRADPDATYTPELHRERHVERVERWRERLRDHLADSAVLDTPAGPHRVDVAWLG